EDRAVHTRADEGIAIGKALGAGNEHGKEIGFLGRAIAPYGFCRSVRSSRLAKVSSLRIDRRNNLVDGRIVAAGSSSPIVEHEDVAFAGKACGNPVGVVLCEKPLLRFAAGAMGPGITPAIK